MSVDDPKRLICGSVTDALLRAVENADSMKNVLILSWQKTKGCKMFSDAAITVSEANMLLDVFKHHLVSGDE